MRRAIFSWLGVLLFLLCVERAEGFPLQGGLTPDDDSADDDSADDEIPGVPLLRDDDGDGYCEQPRCADASLPGDCDDLDPHRWPGAPEIPYDAIDQDCDGKDLMDVDADGFRSTRAGGDDCDDHDPTVHPGDHGDADGDSVDDDCDGVDDEDTPPEDPFACALGGEGSRVDGRRGGAALTMLTGLMLVGIRRRGRRNRRG